MIGAIAGDIIGSVYEWDNIKTKEFVLFSEGCFFTDDTVLTVALADSILTGTPYAEKRARMKMPPQQVCCTVTFSMLLCEKNVARL